MEAVGGCLVFHGAQMSLALDMEAVLLEDEVPVAGAG
jgi:hypothetical protein